MNSSLNSEKRTDNGARAVLLSLLVAVCLWVWFTWPLCGHMTKGIPSSARNRKLAAPRAMIAGDHLQFLYHMWLATDTFFGPTPLFRNVYEFNTGNDAERHEFSTYYLPFSLVFALVASLASQATAWNLTGLLALWMTLWGIWLLAGRYTRDRRAAAVAALLAITLPYRWETLLGGSPTGLAMTWVPFVFLGLDLMVAEKRAWGGFLAGAAIFLAGWSDVHVLFFTVLATPVWCVVSRRFHSDRFLPTKDEFAPLLRACLPLLAFALLVVAQAYLVRLGLKDTAIATRARSLREIALYSPRFRGAFWPRALGHHSQIYLGVVFLCVLFAALCAMVRARIRSPGAVPARHGKGLLLLLAACLGAVLLATGPNNPVSPRLWRLWIRLIPPYGMIRQTAKITLLLPPALAVCLAISLPHLAGLMRRRTMQTFLYSALALCMVADYRSRVQPTICLLDPDQQAYAAVVQDAAESGVRPHLLAIPLWPGNSHWTSLNQYYISLYHIRMLNGYRPTARKRYLDTVFYPFESFNAGFFPEPRIDELVERNIHYVLLHENAYPEKVSPYAVSHVLYQLLAHPRFRLLAQDGPVWAFRIVAAPDGRYAPLPHWPLRCPSRLWQAERCEAEGAELVDDRSASGGRFVRLPAGSAGLHTAVYPQAAESKLAFFVRSRGSGRGRATVYMKDDAELIGQTLTASAEWNWQRVALPPFEGFVPLSIAIAPGDTHRDVDLVMLADVGWDPLLPSGRVSFPAPTFFHAGYTDLDTGEVVLQPDRVAADKVFYGPKLPFPAGDYRIDLRFTTDAPEGTVLGMLTPRYPSPGTEPTPVVAGRPATLQYRNEHNLRVAVDLAYTRAATLRIGAITITRIGECSSLERESQ